MYDEILDAVLQSVAAKIDVPRERLVAQVRPGHVTVTTDGTLLCVMFPPFWAGSPVVPYGPGRDELTAMLEAAFRRAEALSPGDEVVFNEADSFAPPHPVEPT